MNSAAAVRPADRMGAGRKIARLLVVLSLALLSVTLALSTLMLMWTPDSAPPVSLTAGRVDTVDPGSDAARAGLRVGDALAPNTPFLVREALGNAFYVTPARLSFDVIRNGRLIHVLLTVKTFTMDFNPTGPEVPVFLAEILAFLTCVVIGTFVVLVRPTRLTWSFFVFCVGAMLPIGAAEVLCMLPLPLGFILQMLRVALWVAGLCALLSFALRFPSGDVRGWRQRIAAISPIFGVLYFACACAAWIANLYPPLFKYNFLSYVDVIFPLPIAAVSVASVAGTYRSSTPETKQRLKWAVIGIVLGLTALSGHAILRVTNEFWNLEWQVGWETVIGAFIAPMAIAYAILRHRVVDVRFVLNRAVVYAVVTSLLAVTLAATYWIASLVLQEARIAAFVQLVVAIGVGVALHRVYRQLDAAVDLFLFKGRYEAQQHLKRIADGLGRVESVHELDALLSTEPVVALGLLCGTVYHKDDRGHYVRRDSGRAEILPALLPCDEPLFIRSQAHHEAFALSSDLLRKLGSALRDQPVSFALPLHADEALEAVAVYGAHANGADLDPKERLTIAALQSPAERAYVKLSLEARRHRRLSELVQCLPEDTSDDAHVYLAHQFIESIPQRTRIALVAAAAVPDASGEELDLATGNACGVELLRGLAGVSPIVRRGEDATFSVHGLISRAIQQKYAAECTEMLERCALHASEHERHERSAQLFDLAGLESAAAQEREHYLAASDPSLLIRGRDSETFSDWVFDSAGQHPHQWIVRSASRIFSDQAVAQAREGQNVRDSSKDRQPQLLRSWCAYLHAEAGEFDAAQALLDSSPDVAKSFEEDFRTIVASLIASRTGKVHQCERVLGSMAGFFTEELRALKALIRASTIERLHGRWNAERAGIDFAIETMRARNSRFTVWALAEGVVGAWLAGEERLRCRYIEELHAAATQYSAHGFLHFIAAARGEPRKPNGVESPRWLAQADLMAAHNASSWRNAGSFAALALREAVRANEPFLQIVAHITCAHFNESDRYEHLHRALDLSTQVESSVLADAVRSIIADDRDAGILTRLIDGLRRGRAMDGAPLAVDMARGSVRRGSSTISLSERELALALAIARSPNATSVAQLSDLIWPDLDESSGLHAVQTCVHRLRQRLCDATAIESTSRGYRFRNDTVVDLVAIEQFMRNIKTERRLDEFSALRLAAVVNHLEGTRPAYIIGWEWFGPIERRIDEWARAAKYRLAENAMRLGDHGRALVLSQQILARDELDEPAWEISVRALLEQGDRAAAEREFRRYREITLRELNTEPSSELHDLLDAEIVHAELPTSG